jgi:hypothetical protein
VSVLERFKKEQWDAVATQIASAAVLVYHVDMPIGRVTSVVWESLDRLCLFHASALNSYGDLIAAALVAHCQFTTQQLPVDRLLVDNVDFGETCEFDTVVVAPPAVGLFNHLSAELNTHMFWVAPAYRSEFNANMNVKDFRHQLARKDGWRVHADRWDRKEKKAPTWN